MLAFPLLFLLSLLFFRSLVAALLPLMIGALAIVGTFLILSIASEFGSISIFALNLTTGLGLGLAIDYSLFIVSRYREEIAKDGPGLPAMRRTMATAGGRSSSPRSPSPPRSLQPARLPAALPLLDGARRRAGRAARRDRLAHRAARGADAARRPRQLAVARLPPAPGRRRRPARPRQASGTGSRASSCAGRAGWPTLSAAFLIALGLPFLSIKFNTVDPEVLPDDASAQAGLRDDQRTEFPPYRETPIRVVLEGADQRDAPAGSRRAVGHGRDRRRGPAAPARGENHRDRRPSPQTRFISEASQSTVENDPRHRRPRRHGGPRHAAPPPTSSTSRTASPSTCRSPSRSSSSQPC